MSMKVIGALIVGASLALTAPPGRSLAQANEITLAASTSASKNVGSTKHRYWRHRGGTHPHYGSRRVRT
jgi:hypothetical protein